jgi:hypothetical protein
MVLVKPAIFVGIILRGASAVAQSLVPVEIVVSDPLRNYGFNLVLANAGAVSALGQRATQMTALPQLAVALPFSVFIVNNSNRGAIATTVRYEVVKKNGQTRSSSCELHSLGLNASSRSQLAPASVRIVTPENTVTTMFAGSFATLPTLSIELQDRLAQAVGLLNESRSVTIVLDSVVLSDGLLIGPDKTNVLQRFNDFLQAQRDLVTEFLGLVNGAVNDGTLKGWLQTNASQMTQAGKSENYGRARRVLAKTILGGWNNWPTMNERTQSLIDYINGQVVSVHQ